MNPGTGKTYSAPAPAATPAHHGFRTKRQVLTLGQAFRYKRLKLGLSHRQLADLSNVARTTVQQLENGRVANPGILTIFALAEALEIDAMQVLALTRPAAPLDL